MRPRARSEAGVTLMEVLIAVILLSLLSAGMMYAMRLGLNAFSKTDDKLMFNRRVAGAQRILEQQIQGLIPVVTKCGGEDGPRFGFFQGDEQVMRLVSSFSLGAASRGRPQNLEFFVVPGENGKGVRLAVNETPYAGPLTAGGACIGPGEDGILRFLQPQARDTSFVLADKLAFCRFLYFTPGDRPEAPPTWLPRWTKKGWPMAVRVEMAPLEPDPSHLQPISVTAPIYLYRNPEFQYADQ